MNLNLDDFIKEFESNPDAINQLTTEQVDELEKKMNPYGSTIYGDEKYTCLSFTNLREKYMIKLLTTALVGFTYQMCEEHEVDEEDADVKFHVEDWTEIREHPDKNNVDIREKVKEQARNGFLLKYKEEESKKTGVDVEDIQTSEELKEEAKKFADDKVTAVFKDIEIVNYQAMAAAQEVECMKQAETEKKAIKRFLNNLFKFNPNVHAVNSFSGLKKNADPERKSIQTTNEPVFTEVPNDTFTRFQMYYDVNYEKLREAVMYLYSEKPDMEVAINVYDTFNNIEECNEYVEKNKNKVITNISTLTNNKWTFVGSFKQNRDRMDFYNKNTVILENIIKQQEEDAKTGKELLAKRVKKMKTKNIKRYGKDHPNFVKYKKQNLDGVYDTAITKITEEEDEIVVESEVEVSETGARVDADGVPDDALEIKVTSINAKTKEIKQTSIYTKAEDPKIGP